MEHQIANRICDVQGSMIRELFKLANQPGVIAFGGGNPSAQSFPAEEIAQIASEALRNDPVAMLQYGLSEGYTPLRETMKKYLAAREGFDFEQNELYIVSGGQQGADLTAKVLVNDGETVITEDPSFVGCLNTFRSYGIRLAGVPLESDGMSMEQLAEAIGRHKDARLIYTIPTFQNPSGVTTSLEKRKEIYRLAAQHDLLILEDNPYGELRYSGQALPAIKSMDRDGRVLYAGSFSKVMAPAFRLGFLVFDKALAPRITVAKQCTDVHSNVLFQYITNEYMTKCDFEGHIESVRDLYRRKSEKMLDAMTRCFHPQVRFNRPEGGLFIMAFLPEGADSLPFVQEAIRRGVVCVPGAAFGTDQSKPSNSFRLNYSTPSDDDIIKGIEILGKLTYEWLAQSR